MADPLPDVETSALDALADMQRADARLTRLETQLAASQSTAKNLLEAVVAELTAA